MTRPVRLSQNVAWILAASGAATVLIDVAARALTSGEAGLPEQAVSSPPELLENLALIALPLIGGLVAARRPDNPIGWCFLIAGLGLGISNLGNVYAAHGIYRDPGALPMTSFVGWLASWTWMLGIGSLPLL